MGGLKKKMPIVHVTFLVSCIAIAGLPPLAGFFSKDAILAETLAFHPETKALADYYQDNHRREAIGQLRSVQKTKPGEPLNATDAEVASAQAKVRQQYIASVEKLAIWRKVAFALGLLSALLTAFYMFRLYFLTFGGEYRGDHQTYEHAHDAPWPMAVPLLILGALSIVAGWLGTPFAHGNYNFFFKWLDPVLARGKMLVTGHLEPVAEYTLMAISVAVAATGVAIAWAFYKNGPSPVAANLANTLRPVYNTLYNKYYVDELYHLIVVRPLRGISHLAFQLIDRAAIDLAMVRGPGYALFGLGQVGRLLQNGEVQVYLISVVVGVSALAWFLV